MIPRTTATLVAPLLAAILLAAILLTAILLTATGCSNESKDNAATTQIAALLADLPFASSCNQTGNNICVNTYGTAASASSCSNEGGTYATATKCPVADAIGTCKVAATETIFYASNALCSDDNTCRSYCNTTLFGAYSDSYGG